MKAKRVVVIGGGIAGLASAALLAKHGYSVTLLEKNKSLGGRARVLKKRGFQFDMGPSWYMMPEVFEHYFAHFGKKASDFYQLVKLKPAYTAYFNGGEKIVVPVGAENVKALFEKIEAGAGKKFEKYLADARRKYELATPLIYRDMTDLRHWLNLRVLRQALPLLTPWNVFGSWAAYVKKFFKDHRLQKIITFSSVFLGGSPFITPSFFSILSWADFGQGIWYPKGGIQKVVEALVILCKENKVKIVVNADVKSVKFENNLVTGVQTTSQSFECDELVVTGDLAHFETRMLPAKYQSHPASFWRKKTLGISAVLLYLGLNKKLKKTMHHNLYFSDDWQSHFDSIFSTKKLPSDPSFYLSIRTATDTGIAPQNSEELFVLVPVAANSQFNNQKCRELADEVIQKIEMLLQQPIADSLVVKEIYTPKDFEIDYHAHNGTALGLTHTWQQSFIFRPGNRSKKIANMWYAGQYVHPGVGVPMVLASAEAVTHAMGKA